MSLSDLQREPTESPGIAGSAGEESDVETLHRFGYAQQLLRDMGGFSNFAISFSIISILTGAITLYGIGLTSGGPVVMGIGWPLVTLFVLLIAASMAELASAIPTSGALYHWSSLLGGAGWGWLTAWMNLVGLIAAIAGIDYGCAQFLAPLLGMRPGPESEMIVFGGLLLTQAVLNHVGIRVVARLNDISALYHIAGVALVVLSIALFAHKQPLSYVFTRTYTTDTHKPFLLLFLGGLLQAQWTYTGYDASAHTIEETKDARTRAPWGIYLSVAVSGVFGYIMLVLITLAIKNLPAAAAADNPIRYIFDHALGARFAAVVVGTMTGAMWFCGLACITSTSRMIFAFSRDGGMPFSSTWARISPTYRTPAAAVWLAAALAFLLPCFVYGLLLARPGAGKFSVLYPAVTGVSTIGLYLSYGIPVLLKVISVRQGKWHRQADGPWSLGRWSLPVAVIGLAWIAFITVLFVVPPNQLTGYLFGALLFFLAAYYLLAIRRRFRGPIPRSREEMAALEARLNRGGD
ncbi:MAG TPA: amino acid permease [Chthonomonadales bacterium]|nr:amino acid permease [Chthonomonadales bacterium]